MIVKLIVSAVFGGLGGFAQNRLEGMYRRWQLHRHLRMYVPGNQGNMVGARVVNGYVLPLQDCWAYITLGYDPANDILEPEGQNQAFIHLGNRRELKEDRLCWSRAGNPPNIEIYAEEHQALDIVDIEPHGKWIGIPSEMGWEKYRVFLRADRTYKGEIKIVSRDTKARKCAITIDPNCGESPVKLIC